VQPNTNAVRVGDVIHLDVMLGNHGNAHRDFKLASKLDPASTGLEIVLPDGSRRDLKDQLADLGLTAKEGFLSARYVPTMPGGYIAVSTADRVVNHGRPVRSVRSAKACFAAVEGFETIPAELPGCSRALGHALELIPETNPAASGAGVPCSVRVLFRGKPLAGLRVSFIPRGEALGGSSTDLDERFERKTDAEGRAAFTPPAGNYYLVACRVDAPEEKTAEYEATLYSATLLMYVPQVPLPTK